MAASLAFKLPAGTRARPQAPRLLGLMNVGAGALTAREHNLTCTSTNTSMHMPAQQLYQVAAGHSKTRDPPRQEEDSWGGVRARAWLTTQARTLKIDRNPLAW